MPSFLIFLALLAAAPMAVVGQCQSGFQECRSGIAGSLTTYAPGCHKIDYSLTDTRGGGTQNFGSVYILIPSDSCINNPFQTPNVLGFYVNPQCTTRVVDYTAGTTFCQSFPAGVTLTPLSGSGNPITGVRGTCPIRGTPCNAAPPPPPPFLRLNTRKGL